MGPESKQARTTVDLQSWQSIFEARHGNVNTNCQPASESRQARGQQHKQPSSELSRCHRLLFPALSAAAMTWAEADGKQHSMAAIVPLSSHWLKIFCLLIRRKYRGRVEEILRERERERKVDGVGQILPINVSIRVFCMKSVANGH